MQARLLGIPLVLVCPAAGRQKPNRDVFAECEKNAKTQADLNQCASHDDASAEDELNQTYQELLVRAASDAIAVKKIAAAQQAWIAFREAQIAALYPAENKGEYGTVFPMCVNLLRAEFARERIKVLKGMFKKPYAKDVCATGYPPSFQ
jgi:uncharacterized protein YecT (DUF1311 family)